MRSARGWNPACAVESAATVVPTSEALVTALDGRVTTRQVLFPAVLVGALIGAVLATVVAMTSMPELVAMLHTEGAANTALQLTWRALTLAPRR